MKTIITKNGMQLYHNFMLLTVVLIVASALSMVAEPACAQTGQPIKNIVLVHGAFADGSGWEAVANILKKNGYTVSVV